jgi:hypothetical protein
MDALCTITNIEWSAPKWVGIMLQLCHCQILGTVSSTLLVVGIALVPLLLTSLILLHFVRSCSTRRIDGELSTQNSVVARFTQWHWKFKLFQRVFHVVITYVSLLGAMLAVAALLVAAANAVAAIAALTTAVPVATAAAAAAVVMAIMVAMAAPAPMIVIPTAAATVVAATSMVL